MDGAGYIRSCAIHHTFQRAVVVHGTWYATVAHNVAYRARGHNFFTEEGHERYALFDRNLAVDAVPHPLLLGDDVTPAGFWLPGFTGWHRSNLAVGCAVGWKLSVQAGEGARQTDLTFFNNSAHACGFGWRLFPPHQPPTLNVFTTFTAFRCETCMFYYSSGNINHFDHRFVECGRAVHLNHYMNGLHDPPFFTDLVLVGNIDPAATRANAGAPAIHSPKDDEHWLVVRMHVSNYHDTAVLFGCFETACTMRYEGAQWVNSSVRTLSRAGLSGIFHDLDGSLTGFRNGWVTWDESANHWDDCAWDDPRFENGVVCGRADGSLRMRRLLVDGQEPRQLDGKRMAVISGAGVSSIGFEWRKLYGWAVPVIAGRTYDLRPEDPNDWQALRLVYSQRNYVFERHGWAAGNATMVEPVGERLTIHLNYTDWRHHFDASVGSPISGRMPDMLADEYGTYAQKLWPHTCAAYANLSADALLDCSGEYRNSTSYDTRLELNQQPELPWVEGQLTTVVTPLAAPPTLFQEFTARECPSEGCPQPEKFVPGEGYAVRRWSDASIWRCVQLTAGASIRRCSPIPPADAPDGDRRTRRQLRASAARLLGGHGALRLMRAARHGRSASGAADGGAAGAPSIERRRLAEDAAYGLPRAGDDVVIGLRDHILLDVETPQLNWLTIQGHLEASREVNSTVRARSVLVWGLLTLGSADAPIPANVTAVISLYGEPSDHTVVMTDGLFLVNKVLAVLGQVRMAAAPLEAPRHAKLAATAALGDSAIAVRGDFRAWPADALVAIGPTEYPLPPLATEAEALRLAGAPAYDAASDTTTLVLSAQLRHRHFAGRVLSASDGGHFPPLDLAAVVALVGGASNVRVETAEPGSEHGGVMTVGGSVDGAWVGSANLTGVEFVGMGKHGHDHPALHFNFLGASRAAEAQLGRGSVVDGCVFSRSQAGGVQADGASELSLIGNVFHSTYRSAVWVGAGSAHDAIDVLGNAAIETLRHPRDTTDWIEPFAAFLLEVRPRRLEANIAAGSTDSGFVLRPQLAACQAGDDGSPRIGAQSMNEAVGCLTGFFALKACADVEQCDECAQLRGAIAWKNAHAGVIMVDQNANTRLSDLVVADNHIGITLNFRRSFGDVRHRAIYHNVTILGSTAASTCASSTTCRALGQFGSDLAATIGASCNSVVGAEVRRVGVLAHVSNAIGKLCESSKMFVRCRPPTRPVKQCVMPWEHRSGTAASRYSEGIWSAVTFGHFAASDCGQRSAAFTYNPTSIDANYPQRFSDVVWLGSAGADARLRLEKSVGAPTNRVRDCQPGAECDGLSNMILIDTDGSLLGAAPSNGGGTAVSADFGNLADKTCSGRQGHFACPALRLRWLSWEAPGIANVETGRQLGRFKAWREEGGRESWSRGPSGDSCIHSVPEQIRTWAVRPAGNYNLTMFAAAPRNMRLHLFDEDARSSLRLGIFLTQPFRVSVYVGGVKLSGASESSSLSEFAGEGAPRHPTADDPHGTFAMDPIERRFYLTMRGGAARLDGQGAVLLRMSMVVQLSLTTSVSADQFDGAALIDNLATLLQIDRSRIKIVAVQSRSQVAAGSAARSRARRALADDGGAAILVEISEEEEEPDASLLDDTVSAPNASAPEATFSFSEESLSGLQAIAATVWESAQSTDGASSIWADLTMETYPSVSDPFVVPFPPPSPPPSPPAAFGLDGRDDGAEGGMLSGQVSERGNATTSGDAAATASVVLVRFVVPIAGALALVGAGAYLLYVQVKRRAAGRIHALADFDSAGNA